MFVSFFLSLLLSSQSAPASQAMLDCRGSKIKLEAWFSGTPSPEDIFVYEVDPSLGSPAQYQLLDFQWTESNLNLKIESNTDSVLELRLLHDQVNGGFSGVLLASIDGVTWVYPDHRCEFK